MISMIQTKHELIQLLNPIYNHFQLPIFLLSKELLIIESPHSFLKLEEHYFQDMIQENHINDYQTYMHFYHLKLTEFCRYLIGTHPITVSSIT